MVLNFQMDCFITTRTLRASIKIFTLCVFSAFLLQCARSTPELNTLVIGIEADADQLDPRLATDAISSKINRLIYNGLLKTDDDLNLVGDLASEFHFDSPTSLSFTLKEGIKFQNGASFTARDVVATIDSIRQGKVLSPYKAGFDEIQEIKLADDFHLTFILRKPFAPFLTSLLLPILPTSVANGTFQPIGTGPYLLVQKVPREKIVLDRFMGYFDGAAKIQRLKFRIIFDDTLRVLDLIKGRLDLVQNAIPPPLIPALLDQKAWYKPDNVKLQFQSIPGINVAYLGFNLNNEYLKNLAVRKAMALAIDRQALIHYKLKDQATPANSLLNPHHWAYNTGMEKLRHDPALARKYLDEAGFTDPDGDGPLPRMSFTYKTSTRKDRIEMAELIAGQLAFVGIEVNVKPFEWGIFYRDIRQGDFELYSLSWVGITDPDIYYYAFHSSQTPPNGANRGYYHNDKIDHWIEGSQSAVDRDERKGFVYQTQKLLLDELPIVPLWFENNYVAYNARLKNYHLRTDAGFQGLINAELEP